jgi:hypothetical protein
MRKDEQVFLDIAKANLDVGSLSRVPDYGNDRLV